MTQTRPRVRELTSAALRFEKEAKREKKKKKKKKKKWKKKKKETKKKHAADYTALNHSERGNLSPKYGITLVLPLLGFFHPNNLLNIRAASIKSRVPSPPSRNSPLIRLAACLIIVLAKGACDTSPENMFA